MQKDSQLAGFQQHQEELHQKLESCRHFIALPPKRQVELLKGDKDHMTQDEIMDRMGEDKAWFRGLYRFFSAHTHSSPLSFYRMAESGRGREVENDVDKGYIAVALQLAEKFMKRASEEMLRIFPDAVPTVQPIVKVG